MPVGVKICGVKTKEVVEAAVLHGADFIGFNFCRKSPRFITPDTAAGLAPSVPPTVRKVALFVDPSDAELEHVLTQFSADLLQLHGSETPDRLSAIKERFKLPVMKALHVADEYDLEEHIPYESIADFLLFDARPSYEAELPGGNATVFEWGLLKQKGINHVWFLAGGLNAKNLREAVEQSGALYVDVSSGVEEVRGEKDIGLVQEFLEVAKKI